MHGYLTPEGEYYETNDGPIHHADVQVPLRPSLTYKFDSNNGTWRNTHGTMGHNYPRIEQDDQMVVSLTEKKLLSLRDAFYMLGIIGSAIAVYFGVITDVRQTKEQIYEIKTSLAEHQSYATKELGECKDKIHALEIENAKHR